MFIKCSEARRSMTVWVFILAIAATVRLTSAEAQLPSTLTTPTPPAYSLTVNGEEPYDSGSDAYSIAPYEIAYVVNVAGAGPTPTGSVTFWNGTSLACPEQGVVGGAEDPAQIAGTIPPAKPDQYYNTLATGSTTASIAGPTAAILDMNGNASFAVDCLTPSENTNTNYIVSTPFTLTAVYNGDANYAGQISPSLAFTLLRNPSVLIQSSPATLSVAPGSTTTATLSVASVLGYGVAGANSNLNNYGFPLQLGCEGLPAHATCSFSLPQTACSASITAQPLPATTDPAPGVICVVAGTPSATNQTALGTPNTMMVTINTNVSSGTVATSSNRKDTLTWAGFLGLGMLGVALRRRKFLNQKLLSALLLIFLCGAVAGLSACSTTNIAQAPILTTPAGTYQVSISAHETGDIYIPGTTTGTYQLLGGNSNEIAIPNTITLTVQ